MKPASPSVSLLEVIETLRSAKDSQTVNPTASQVRSIIDGLEQGVFLDDMPLREDLKDFTPGQILSIAGEFGRHRARVLKTKLTNRHVSSAAISSGMLIPPTMQEIREVHGRIMSGRPPLKRQRWVMPFADEAFEEYILPVGWDRDGGFGGDYHKSLSAVFAAPVEDAELDRFVERTFAKVTTKLDADHVCLLHWLASHGMAVKLLDLVEGDGPQNVPLAHLFVEAYDLLEVERHDAMVALGRLMRGEVTQLPDIRRALAQSRWLAPGQLGRLDRLAEQVQRNPDNTRLSRILTERLDSLRLSVRSNQDAFIVRDVEHLSSAHLAQILTANGLGVDEVEEKAVALELRTRLTQMGLVNDLDRELPEGLRAWRAGRLEEFYASRQARCDGDPEWRTIYEPALVELVS